MLIFCIPGQKCNFYSVVLQQIPKRLAPSSTNGSLVANYASKRETTPGRVVKTEYHKIISTLNNGCFCKELVSFFLVKNLRVLHS